MDVGDQGFGPAQVAEDRRHVAVVGHVVAAVGERGRIPGRDPDRVDPELG
jgi:hypothetical protein